MVFDRKYRESLSKDSFFLLEQMDRLWYNEKNKRRTGRYFMTIIKENT